MTTIIAKTIETGQTVYIALPPSKEILTRIRILAQEGNESLKIPLARTIKTADKKKIGSISPGSLDPKSIQAAPFTTP